MIQYTLFISFYIAIPCFLTVLAIYKLVTLKRRGSESSTRLGFSRNLLNSLLTLPYLFRTDPIRAMKEFGNICRSLTYYLFHLREHFLAFCGPSVPDFQKGILFTNVSTYLPNSLANIFEQFIEAIRNEDKQLYFASLNNLIGLSLLKDRYRPWIPPF